MPGVRSLQPASQPRLSADCPQVAWAAREHQTSRSSTAQRASRQWESASRLRGLRRARGRQRSWVPPNTKEPLRWRSSCARTAAQARKAESPSRAPSAPRRGARAKRAACSAARSVVVRNGCRRQGARPQAVQAPRALHPSEMRACVPCGRSPLRRAHRGACATAVNNALRGLAASSSSPVAQRLRGCHAPPRAAVLYTCPGARARAGVPSYGHRHDALANPVDSDISSRQQRTGSASSSSRCAPRRKWRQSRQA